MKQQKYILVIIFTLLFGVNVYAKKIYDVIDSLKQHGTVYDAGMIKSSDASIPAPTGNATKLLKRMQNRNPSRVDAPSPFMSSKWGDYGNSKYDKGLSFMDDIANTGSLDDIRNDKDNNITAMLIILVIIVVVMLLFLLTTRKSKTLEDKNDNSNRR